jgi:hypothetical protein
MTGLHILPLADAAQAGGDPLSASGVTALGFVLGAVIGSFLAAVLIRWPQGRSLPRRRERR